MKGDNDYSPITTYDLMKVSEPSFNKIRDLPEEDVWDKYPARTERNKYLNEKIS